MTALVMDSTNAQTILHFRHVEIKDYLVATLGLRSYECDSGFFFESDHLSSSLELAVLSLEACNRQGNCC